LLALCEKAPQRPYYSEEGLRVKLKRSERKDPLYGHLVHHRGEDPLLKSECAEVFSRARLTPRQKEVLLRRLEGWTFEEIGNASGHSRQGAQHIFIQSLKKIARSFHVYPFRGLSEVYRWETRRGSPRAGAGKIAQTAH
jgi:hypothetical protein